MMVDNGFCRRTIEDLGSAIEPAAGIDTDYDNVVPIISCVWGGRTIGQPCEYIQPYGLYTRPDGETRTILLKNNNDESEKAAIVTDPLTRKTGLTAGDVVLHSPAGNADVYIHNDGSIDITTTKNNITITSSGSITISGTGVTINTDVTINGTLTVSGNASMSTADFSGNINVTTINNAPYPPP